MAVRTNNLVQLDWRGTDDELTASVYHDGETNQFTIDDLDVVQILEYALTARTRDELRDFVLTEVEHDERKAEELIETLSDAGFLLPEDHENFTKYEMWMEKNWQRALFYHLKTRRTNAKLPSSEAGDGDQLADEDQEYGKPYPTFDEDELIALPEPADLPDEPFGQVARRRRTHRNFKGNAIDMETLSTLLYHTFKPVKEAQEHVENTELSDISPGAARRIGFDVYMALMRCEGQPPGIYQYSIQDHALHRIHEFDEVEQADHLVVETAHKQEWTAGSAVTFFFSSVFQREQKWSQDSRGLRNSYINVSEHAHRLILVATALRLRNFLTPAIKDSYIDEKVGLDGYSEAVMYLVSIGE